MKDESVSATEALDLAAQYVAARAAQKVRADALVHDGWPAGCIASEAVWSISVLDEPLVLGGTRVVCVSKRTGDIVFDGRVGE
jgi:hypothetical protein